MHLGLLKDHLRFLAGDPSHSRSVSRSVRPLYFLRLGYLKDSNAASHFVNSLILFALSRTA